MVKAFRPSLEPPAHRQVRVTQAARPGLCLLICAGVTVLLLGAFAASGWNIYVNRFDTNRFKFSSGDEVAVSDITSDFSSVFCDSYEVKLWARGQVYLLPSKAEVNTSLLGQEEFFSMLQIAGLVYTETKLYLLDQSEFSFSACRQNGSLQVPAEVVLIRGKSNLITWRENKECNDCVLHHIEIPLSAYCTSDMKEKEDLHKELEETSSVKVETPPELSGLNVDTLIPNANNDANLASESLKHKAAELNETSMAALAEKNVSQSMRREKSSILPSESDTTTIKRHKQSQPVLFNYTVTGNDKYFLVIFYGRPSGPESLFTEPGIQLKGKVQRTSFDVRKARQVCNLTGIYLERDHKPENSSSANSCHFHLPWSSDMDVVVHFGDPVMRHSQKNGYKHGFHGSDRGFSEGYMSSIALLADPNHGQEGMMTRCHVRLTIWICLFAVLPVVLAFIFSTVIGCFLCKGRPSQQFTAKWHRHRHGRKKRILGSETRVKDSEVLVDAEVLPEGDQSSMAIQGD